MSLDQIYKRPNPLIKSLKTNRKKEYERALHIA
jgi:hypothetical protein